MSTTASTTASATASATSSAASSSISMPPQFKVVGAALARIAGSMLMSTRNHPRRRLRRAHRRQLCLQKGACPAPRPARSLTHSRPPPEQKGLIKSQAGHEAGEGVAYLKSALWWTGMSMMILGEICNFAAYAFVDAIVVTPLGALSVVISAILSSFFLNEKLTFFGWVGCFLCIVGSVIIALNGPKEQSVGTIREFERLFISVGFLIFGGLLIAAAIVIIFFVAPKYGKKNMIWYILVCSLIGGLSVSCTQGLGTAIVTSIRGQNQFTYWFTYFLLVFVIITLLTEIYYLNMALALFNTAMVTPTYYVIFTFCTLVTSVILYQGFKATVTEIITVVMGFLVICAGITILQMSKVDPTTLSSLDRKSTILLAANRSTQDAEKGDLSAIEEPGVDAIRGTFGAFGSVVRARSARRMSQSSSVGTVRSRRAAHGHSRDNSAGMLKATPSLGGMQRHQLFDNPVPPLPEDAAERISMYSNIASPRSKPNIAPGLQSPKKNTIIQFREQDLAGHDHPDPEENRQSLALDDFIQRTASPTSAPAGVSSRPLYDDPYLPRSAAAGYNRYELRQDSINSFSEHDHRRDSASPEGADSPPRVTGHGRFQRAYPHDREMDREESLSLVSSARGTDLETEDEHGLGQPGMAHGGIRLVPSLPRR
ncbi:Magnesium transporter NIPA [Ceratobasidium sp. AG-Ba]|nr:Magnesium transporter NIPA [Ceratobasidium sp. AG-Ba]